MVLMPLNLVDQRQNKGLLSKKFERAHLPGVKIFVLAGLPLSDTENLYSLNNGGSLSGLAFPERFALSQWKVRQKGWEVQVPLFFRTFLRGGFGGCNPPFFFYPQSGPLITDD